MSPGYGVNYYLGGQSWAKDVLSKDYSRDELRDVAIEFAADRALTPTQADEFFRGVRDVWDEMSKNRQLREQLTKDMAERARRIFES